MEVEVLLDIPGFTIMNVSKTEGIVEISARSSAVQGCCPDCQAPSTQVHSWYERHPRELPCQGQSMYLHLEVQRFFCKNKQCQRRTFVKSLPDVVVKHAQRTVGFTKQLRAIAFHAGGKSGARLAQQLGLPTSPKTLLRIVEQTVMPDYASPRILGVDDWALRKGKRYGTILVDLEQHQVIELLPDREAETLEKWLAAHPEILVISRDRGTNYIDAATQGAPQALQVADRWHLLKNLREAVQTLLGQYRTLLKIKTEVAIIVPKFVPIAVATGIGWQGTFQDRSSELRKA